MMRLRRLLAHMALATESGPRATRGSAEPSRGVLYRALRAELQRPQPDWARVAEIERALAPEGRLGEVEKRIAGKRWAVAGIELA